MSRPKVYLITSIVIGALQGACFALGAMRGVVGNAYMTAIAEWTSLFLFLVLIFYLIPRGFTLLLRAPELKLPLIGVLLNITALLLVGWSIVYVMTPTLF